METLRSFVLQLATAGILTAVADTLAPEKGSGKMIKLFTALFFMVSIMAPILGFSEGEPVRFPSVNEEVTYDEDTAAAISRALDVQIQQSALKQGQEALKNAELSAEIKTVEIVRDNDGNILVSRIVLCKDTGSEKAEKLLKELFGNSVEVVDEKDVEFAPGT